MRRACSALALLALLGLSAQVAPAQAPPEVRVRAGYFGAWNEARDGTSHETHAGQVRVLAANMWELRPDLRLRVGLGGRLSTVQEGFRVLSPTHQTGPEGVRPGEVALSQLHLSWLPAEGWEVRAGRMQLSFILPGAPSKGLLRSESPNMEIHWTDGVHVRADVAGRAHLALIHTSPGGVSTPFRAPLTFDSRTGRAAVFAGWEALEPRGPLVHRALLATVIPGALPTADGGRSAYAGASAQGAVAFPVGGPRLVVAGEAAWSPTPPEREVLRLRGTGRDLAAAGQLSVNLMGFGGGDHDLGLITTAAAPGWLLSSDVRPNNREAEVRYYWRFTPGWRLDFRLRRRQDLVVPAGALRGRDDWDTYVRLDIRF
jgi:hypothetical protein